MDAQVLRCHFDAVFVWHFPTAAYWKCTQLAGAAFGGSPDGFLSHIRKDGRRRELSEFYCEGDHFWVFRVRWIQARNIEGAVWSHQYAIIVASIQEIQILTPYKLNYVYFTEEYAVLQTSKLLNTTMFHKDYTCYISSACITCFKSSLWIESISSYSINRKRNTSDYFRIGVKFLDF